MKTYGRLLMATWVWLAILCVMAAWPAGATMSAPVDLGVLEGCTHSQATDINEAGQVVGFCFIPDANGCYTAQQAFLWQDGVMTALPPLPGYPFSVAYQINASGQIMGMSGNDAGGYETCIWDTGGNVTAVGLLPGAVMSDPRDLNDAGQVCGVCYDADYNPQGFLWQSGFLAALTDEAGTPFTPYAINAAGQMAGQVNAGEYPAATCDVDTVSVLSPGQNAMPCSINSQGQVVGGMSSPGTFLYLPAAAYGMAAGFHAFPFSWDDFDFRGVLQINDAGQVLAYYMPVGSSWSAVTVNSLATGTAWEVQFAGEFDNACMNAGGQVAVTADEPMFDELGEFLGYRTSSFCAQSATSKELLPSLGGQTDGSDGPTNVAAINDAGQIVGASPATSGGPYHATLWSPVAAANQAPTLALPWAGMGGQVGTPVTFTAMASDPDASDTLTFSLVGAPAGTAIDPNTGVFTWTPTAGGVFSFEVKVTDAGGLSDSKPFSISVVVPSSLNVSGFTAKRDRKGTVSVSFTLTNAKTAAAADVSVTSGTLNGVATVTKLPVALRTIRAGASKSCTLQFKNVGPGMPTFSVSGTCSLGSFGAASPVTVP